MAKSFVGPLQTHAINSSSRSTTAVYNVGTRAYDADGGVWVYVKAGASIAQYDAVIVSGADLSDVRPTSAVNQLVLGVADAAFASGEYGFVQVQGLCTAKVVNATAAKSLLASTATAGTLGVAVNTDLQGRGASAQATGVAAGSAVYLS